MSGYIVMIVWRDFVVNGIQLSYLTSFYLFFSSLVFKLQIMCLKEVLTKKQVLHY